jgi:hypothetical protein
MQTIDGADLLVAYSAGRLAPRVEYAVRAHLAECADCRMVASAQAEVWSVLDSWEPLPVSADFNRKVYARIAQEDQSQWWIRASRAVSRFDWSLRPAMPVAAACAALLVAFLLNSPFVHDGQPKSAVVESRVDIEKLERALDDIDMLKQVGVVTPCVGNCTTVEPM